MFDRWQDQVSFLVVYIAEAHPEEGWVISPNRDQDIVVNDPVTAEQRHEVAQVCALRLQIRMPVVIDAMDDAIASAYGALPDRLYLIDGDGRVAYQGERGPWGFKPEELDAAIAELVEAG